MKFSKFWPVLGAICTSLLAATLQADELYGNMQQGGGSCCCDPCLFQGLYERGTYREITPCAGPRVFSGWDVVVTADYIYWKTVQDGTAYATSGVFFSPSPAATPFANVATGKQRSVAQDWSSGFKVGLGFDMCHDCWDIMVQYTWLRPSHRSHLSARGPSAGSDDCECPEEPSLGNQLVAQFLGGGSYSTLLDDPIVIGDSASSRWKMKFNVIDLELGRNFYLSQHLTMRPHIGLKGTWQKQNIRTSIRGPFFQIPLDDGTALAVTGPYRMHFKNRTYGVGIRGGFDLSWYLSRTVSIFGNLAWTAMWTDYDRIHRIDKLCNCTGTVDSCGCECSCECDEECKKVLGIHKQCGPKRYFSVKYVGEMELGLRWETWVCDESYHFAIQAGWEEQVWINWATFAQVIGEGFHDLTFHGLNLKFRFDF